MGAIGLIKLSSRICKLFKGPRILVDLLLEVNYTRGRALLHMMRVLALALLLAVDTGSPTQGGAPVPDRIAVAGDASAVEGRGAGVQARGVHRCTPRQ